MTTARPTVYRTPLGRFSYRHVGLRRYWGYLTVSSAQGLGLIVARAEKAILDLAYLTPGGAEMDFLSELRLQNTGQIDPETLHRFAERFGTPKMMRACRNITRIIRRGEGVEL